MKKESRAQKEANKGPGAMLASVILARNESKHRNFTQTWDFCISVKGLNLKKPENRFSVDVALPKGRGREPTVAVFADNIASEAEKSANVVIRKSEISGMAKDRKRLGEIISCDICLGEASLMTLIGKELGPALAPKGKMPRPIPPNIRLDTFIAASKNMLKVALKESPAIHAAIGNEKMPDEDVAANAEAVFNAVVEKMPKGMNNIKSACIKLTMGRPVKIALK